MAGVAKISQMISYKLCSNLIPNSSPAAVAQRRRQFLLSTINYQLLTMSLEQKVMAEMKDAMKAKDEANLRGLRAIKAEIIKAKTEPGAGGEINADKEISMLQKMTKQRKDSLEMYQQQNRPDLAQKEQEEIALIER